MDCDFVEFSDFSCWFGICVELGVLQWKLNPKKYGDDEELESIRTTRGYNYMVLILHLLI